MRTLRQSFRASAAALLVGTALLACAAVTGLGDYEITDLDAAVDAAPDVTPVVRPDAGTDGPIACAPSTCGPPDSGAFSVVLAGDGDQPCPATYTTTNTITSPTTNASTPSCACGDCSASVSCASGALATMHTGASCGTAGVTFPNTLPGACNNNTQAASTSDAGHVEPPAAVIGACSAPATGIRSAIITTPKRICTPSCVGDACSAPAGFATCLLSDGDVACPAAELDMEKTLVGEDVAITCPACSCTMTAQCMGTLDRYSDVDCTGAKATVTTGACLPQTAGMTIKSYRWTGSPIPSCTKGAAPTPTLALMKVKTLCCSKSGPK